MDSVQNIERILKNAVGKSEADQIQAATDALIEAEGINTPRDRTDDGIDANERAALARRACFLVPAARKFIEDNYGGPALACSGPQPVQPGGNQPVQPNIAPVRGSQVARDAARDASRELRELLEFRYRTFGFGFFGYYDWSELKNTFNDPNGLYVPSWVQPYDRYSSIHNPYDNRFVYPTFGIGDSYRGTGVFGLQLAIEENIDRTNRTLNMVRSALDLNPTRGQMQNVRHQLYDLKRQAHVIADGYFDPFPLYLETQSQVREMQRLISKIDRLPSR